jgi:hypothetical protein
MQLHVEVKKIRIRARKHILGCIMLELLYKTNLVANFPLALEKLIPPICCQ